MRFVVRTRSPEETRLLGEVLAELAGEGALFALGGDLGAGKTVFTQGVARALGVADIVTSPTFTLVNEYSGKCPLYHVDLYRVEGPLDVWDLGLEDYLEGHGVVVVEWADKAGELLDLPRVWKLFFCILEEGRDIEVVPPQDVESSKLKEALTRIWVEVVEWKGF